MDIVLTPVVELCPSKYQSSDHPWPTVSSAESPEAWDTYWRTCLGDVDEWCTETVRTFGERLRPRIAAMDPTVPVDDMLEVMLRGHSSID